MVFTDEFKHDLVKLWPMIPTITSYKLNHVGVFILCILTINVEASDIKMNRIGRQAQFINNTLSNNLIER